jgi:hypothetical protein
MADILIDNQAAPTTPASGKSVLYVDSTTKKLVARDDGGTDRGGTISKNSSVGQQTGFAADAYITGSNILIPSSGFQVGQLYKWEVCIEKTAAGVATVAVNIRIGSAAALADTSRAAPTTTVIQTATASATIMFVSALVRTVSASGVIVASLGFTAAPFGDGDRLVSATFDDTALAGQFIGLSLNGGASAAYTIDSVVGYLIS